MIELTDHQKRIQDIVTDWYVGSKSRYLTIGGYAGTGKTTLIGYIRQNLKKENLPQKKKEIKVAFCAYTGKAAKVLESKLKETKIMFTGDNVSTIHSLIYTAIKGSNGDVVGWEKKDKIDYDLIIIDEASMVDESIWSDINFYNIPILAVGDHGQLPPIGGNFNLMEKPHLRLEKIHRQAEGNPIIHLSKLARLEGKIDVGDYGNGVRKLDRFDMDTQEEISDAFYGFDEGMLVLCGLNNTRVKLNHQIRNQLGFEEPGLESGERIICVRTNYKDGLINGMQGYVNKIYEDGDHHYQAEIIFDYEEEPFVGKVLKQQVDSTSVIRKVKGLSHANTFNNIDRGYALTVHKAQGSQARKVVLFEERFSHMDDEAWRRWLYTAITRAEEELLIIGK